MFWFKKKKSPRPEKIRVAKHFGVVCLRLAILLGILCAVTATCWTGVAFYRFVFRSEYFLVRDIVITKPPADRGVSTAINQILHDSAIRGQNLIFLKTEDIRADLETIPKVKRVLIRKDYPACVTIEVIERQMAGLILHDPILAIDREGVVIETLVPQDPRVLRQPLISGLPSSGMELGDKIRSEILTRALLLVSCLEKRSPVLFHKTSEVHCDNENNITLLLQGGTEIRFGVGNPIIKMPALETVLEKQGPVERYAYIDLRFDNQVPCMPKAEAAMAAAVANKP